MVYNMQLKIWFCTTLLLILSGCGGDGSGDSVVEIYTLAANSDSNGSISPASKTVHHGNTATFTIAANQGYEIDTISGCAGVLSDDIYTTETVTAACTVSATYKRIKLSAINFTDDNLKQCVIDTGHEYASQVLTLACLGKNIISSEGIEKLTELTSIDLQSNELTSIDLSKNTKLWSIDLRSNKLTSIDVSKNTALSVLSLNDNQLTNIDVFFGFSQNLYRSF